VASTPGEKITKVLNQSLICESRKVDKTNGKTGGLSETAFVTMTNGNAQVMLPASALAYPSPLIISCISSLHIHFLVMLKNLQYLVLKYS